MIILAIDPGDTSGIAKFDTTGEKPYQPTHIAAVKKYNGLFKELQSHTDANVVVIENYRIRPGVTHDWSSVDTIRYIGYIHYWADLHGITVHLQEPVDKVPAYGWLGMKYQKGKKNMHIPDAVAHGAFYMYKKLNMELP